MLLSAASVIQERKEGMLDRTYVAGQDNIHTATVRLTCILVCEKVIFFNV